MPQAKPVYMLTPAGLLDRTDPRITRHTGQLVQKVQPAGTPRNGVMGMCFVQHADTGEFIGQVCESSLTPPATGRCPPTSPARHASAAHPAAATSAAA